MALSDWGVSYEWKTDLSGVKCKHYSMMLKGNADHKKIREWICNVNFDVEFIYMDHAKNSLVLQAVVVAADKKYQPERLDLEATLIPGQSIQLIDIQVRFWENNVKSYIRNVNSVNATPCNLSAADTLKFTYCLDLSSLYLDMDQVVL